MTMLLARDLTVNRLVVDPALAQTTAGEVFGAGFQMPTMGGLLGRQAQINRDTTGIEVVREPNGMTTLREVERPDAIPAETLNAQYKELGLNFDRAMPADTAKIIADEKRAEIIRNDIMARGPGGLTGALAGLGGGLIGMATDPLEVATAFIPVVGPARELWLTTRLGRIGGQTAVGVIEGGVGNALTEPIYYGLSQSQQLDYGMSDSLMNIGLGAVLGGVLGTGAGIAGRVMGGAEVPAVRPVQRVSEGAVVEPPDVSLARAPLPDPRQGMTAKQRHDALNLSVAQMANGRAVDIPVPRRPMTTMEALQRVGVRDESGDLASMGVKEWDKARPFKTNLIRDDGMDRDKAARWLWDNGYLRDQPEATEMRAAEQGLGPEPDLVAAMDRAIDDELRGSPRFSEQAQTELERHAGGAALREQVDRRNRMRETLGPQAEGLRDRLIDDVIARVDQGEEPAGALRGALGFEQERAATDLAPPAERAAEPMPGWGDEDLDAIDARRAGEQFARDLVDEEADAAIREVDDLLATAGTAGAEDEEATWITAQIEDARRQGFITEEQERDLADFEAFETKALTFAEVARAASACLVRGT